ncbi:MAG: glucose-1-phosphate thymidylyltransferase RfbA [Rickettsiaceae bacterium]|nr:glucose-1-phosphate thymidylyltransferase RfbA [Rickettsiaceae bacterium]
MKGIILAGGLGTRLYPITSAISKQLLPVYDKPMIYYPLSNLMQAGIRDILIISTKEDLPRIEKALGDGSDFGVRLSYIPQESPAGIAQSFILGEKFIGDSSVCLILGDNIFYSPVFSAQVAKACKLKDGAIVFGYRVSDPERYGVVEFENDGTVKQILEKPKNYVSNYAVTGLYFYDNTVVQKAKQLKPSARGELEISDIQNLYLQEKKLSVAILEQGTAWLDAGTFESLLEASHYVQVMEKRQGIKIACPEEIAFNQGWITHSDLVKRISKLKSNSYVDYLHRLIS